MKRKGKCLCQKGEYRGRKRRGALRNSWLSKWSKKVGKCSHCRKLANTHPIPRPPAPATTTWGGCRESHSQRPHCLRECARQRSDGSGRQLVEAWCARCHLEQPPQSLCVPVVAACGICPARPHCLENTAGWVSVPLPGSVPPCRARPHNLRRDPASAPVFSFLRSSGGSPSIAYLQLVVRTLSGKEKWYLTRSLCLIESRLLAQGGIFKSIFLLIIPSIAHCSCTFSIFWGRTFWFISRFYSRPSDSRVCVIWTLSQLVELHF